MGKLRLMRRRDEFFEAEIEGRNLITTSSEKKTKEGYQTREKKFPSSGKALEAYRGLVGQKLLEGYKPTLESMAALLAGLPPATNPLIIGSSYVGEGAPHIIATDICGWLTVCLQNGIAPEQFKSIWGRLLRGEDEDESLIESLGRLGDNYWTENIERTDDGLDKLYALAVKRGADRFTWVKARIKVAREDSPRFTSCIYILALKGDPGSRAIEGFAPEKIVDGAEFLCVISSRVAH